MKKIIPLVLTVLILFSSCSLSMSETLENFTMAMNTNVFIKNKLTNSEKETLQEALTVDTLPIEDGKLRSQSRTISVLDGSKVEIQLKFAQDLCGKDFKMLEVIPNDVREELAILFNNRVKADEIRAYLSTPLEGATKETVEKCARSITDVVDKSFAGINYPDTETGEKVKKAVNDVRDGINKAIEEPFKSLKKGDVLAISVLSSSINNIIAKVGAQACALGESGNEFDVFSFDWSTLFEEGNKNSEKYILSLIDSVAHELAILNAILPHCGSFINFDIKAIANNFIGESK